MQHISERVHTTSDIHSPWLPGCSGVMQRKGTWMKLSERDVNSHQHKTPTDFTGKWEKGRECELRHGYLRGTKDAWLRDAWQPPLLLSPSNNKPPCTAKFKFRCLPFYTAILELESKAKCRTYPAFSCHIKGPQNFSVVLFPPPWLTLSAGNHGAVCIGEISRISNLAFACFTEVWEREKMWSHGWITSKMTAGGSSSRPGWTS